ncbi:hypothetical protein RHMOL_Rhmol02G0049300 [Rhododendron molle]|uniref:Uncharacterized protein n=1 Tax=Rhododendron molle TaxID=49168 RepID=A0ACC0PM55_RHOML|nr:hypothetical protein RHMOL_Rhmol02G0049300 [Rhododendron molle]
MTKVVITITRTAEVECPPTCTVVAFDAEEMEAPQVGPASITDHEPLAGDHVEESNTFPKIQGAVVVFVQEFEQVGRDVLVVAFLFEEIQVLLDAHVPVSVCVYRFVETLNH